MIRLQQEEVGRRMAYGYQLIVSLLIAGVFLASSLPHLTNPYYFLSSIFQYKLVNAPVGEFTAMVIPFLQLFASVCLLIRVCVGGAFLMSSGLFLVFTVVQASAALRHMNISCGCFGPSHTSPITPESVLLVGALFALSLSGYWCFVVSGREASNGTSPKLEVPPDAATP